MSKSMSVKLSLLFVLATASLGFAQEERFAIENGDISCTVQVQGAPTVAVFQIASMRVLLTTLNATTGTALDVESFEDLGDGSHRVVVKGSGSNLEGLLRIGPRQITLVLTNIDAAGNRLRLPLNPVCKRIP